MFGLSELKHVALKNKKKKDKTAADFVSLQLQKSLDC